MPWVEFEPTIPAFERAKTFDALHRTVTKIDSMINADGIISRFRCVYVYIVFTLHCHSDLSVLLQHP
jgi:hypothetical protein